jgi:hypothetical protein
MIIIIIIIIVLMESKDYERHSETIIIPPAHVALRCDNRHLEAVEGYARASNLGMHSCC